MFCHKCGNKIAEGAEFCHKCGSKTVTQTHDEVSTTTEPMPQVSNKPVSTSASGAGGKASQNQTTKNTKPQGGGCLSTILAPVCVALIIGGFLTGGTVGIVLFVIAGAIFIFVGVFEVVSNWKSRTKKSKMIFLGVAGAVVVAIIITAVVMLRSGDEPLVGTWDNVGTSNNPLQATFGSRFSYFGLEYTIGDSWVIEDRGWGNYSIRIPVSMTNISNGEVSLLSIGIQVWCPNGLSLLPQFTTVASVGELGAPTSLRPGATLETFFGFEYQGDGTYEIDLSEWFGLDTEVDVTITLPITRTGASQQPTQPQDTDVPTSQAGTGLTDHHFTFGITPFVISIPPNWYYEMSVDGPDTVFIRGEVPGGRITMSVEGLWVNSFHEIADGSMSATDFAFDDGYIGLSMVFMDWGSRFVWAREDMWMQISLNWDHLDMTNEYVDLFNSVARSLRHP